MNKKIIKCIEVLCIMLLLSNCGNTDSSSELTNENNTETYSISGVVNLDAQTQNGLAKQVVNYVNSLTLFVQNQANEKIYTTDINSDGTYSLNVDLVNNETNGNSYMIGLLDKDTLTYRSTIMKSIDNSTDEALSGISITADVTDFNINVNATNGNATVDSLPDNSQTNDELKIKLTDNKPCGVDNKGKGDNSKSSETSSVNKLDPDQDGLPNIFDSMDNGKDIDNTNIETSKSNIAGSIISSQASMFMNYKVPVNAEDKTITTNAIITIEVHVDDPSQISSISADVVHPNYQDATISMFPVGFTQIDTYPSAGTLWSDNSYNLYHAKNLESKDIWTVFIKPNNNLFDVGNIIRLQANLVDGTSEYYWLTINFKFQEFEITDNTNWEYGGSGSTIDPYCILNTGGRVFYWNAPQDETGADLIDLNYQFELFYLENEAPESVVHTGITEIQDIGIDIYTDQLTEETINEYQDVDPSPNILQVDIKASYPYGDNTALILYMQRKEWTDTHCN